MHLRPIFFNLEMTPRMVMVGLGLSAMLVPVSFGQVEPRPVEGELASAVAPAVPAKPLRSRVAVVEDPTLVTRFRVDGDRAAEVFNRALMALTGRATLREAWLSFIRPSDRIGVKISTSGLGNYGSTPAVIGVILDGLRQAGVPMERVIVWDRAPAAMTAAGFAPGRGAGGWRNLAVFPGLGYDPDVFYFNEVVGQLIWGDHEFRGRSFDVAAMLDVADPKGAADRARPKREVVASAQTSNRSYFSRIITREVDKIINVAAMSDHPDVGLHGCLASLALAAVDNYRRFLGRGIHGDPALAELWEHDALRGKVVLNVMDGLVAQFAGGPTFTPNYAQPAGVLMLSRDPVAIDAMALERLERWRAERQVVEIGGLARHVRSAASAGVGQGDPTKMEVVRVR